METGLPPLDEADIGQARRPSIADASEAGRLTGARPTTSAMHTFAGSVGRALVPPEAWRTPRLAAHEQRHQRSNRCQRIEKAPAADSRGPNSTT